MKKGLEFMFFGLAMSEKSNLFECLSCFFTLFLIFHFFILWFCHGIIHFGLAIIILCFSCFTFLPILVWFLYLVHTLFWRWSNFTEVVSYEVDYLVPKFCEVVSYARVKHLWGPNSGRSKSWKLSWRL